MLLLLAAPLGASVVRAQEGTRVVSGVVVDSVTQRVLADAEAYFGPGRAAGESGPDGRFAVSALAADSVLVVRRIGYVPVRLRIRPSVSAALIDVGTIALRPVATRLDRIAVEAEEVNRYPELADFYRRKKSYPGAFVTPEQLERVSKPTDALRMVPSVMVVCPRSGFQCGVAGRRAGARCAMALFVDGILQNNMVLDDVPVTEIAGIEVYTGLGSTPAYFSKNSCGSVVVWTRRG